MAHHLHGVHMQAHAGAPALGANCFQGLEAAHLALPPDQRHQACWRSQQLLQLLKTDQAGPIHRQPGQLPALLLQAGGGRLRGRMLHRRDHQPPDGVLGRQAQQGHLNRFGAPRAPHQLVGLGAEMVGQAAAAAFERFSRRQPEAMQAGGIGPDQRGRRRHRRQRRLARGRGGAGVQVLGQIPWALGSPPGGGGCGGHAVNRPDRHRGASDPAAGLLRSWWQLPPIHQGIAFPAVVAPGPGPRRWGRPRAARSPGRRPRRSR